MATAPPDPAEGGRAKSTHRFGPHRSAYARTRGGFPSVPAVPQPPRGPPLRMRPGRRFVRARPSRSRAADRPARCRPAARSGHRRSGEPSRPGGAVDRSAGGPVPGRSPVRRAAAYVRTRAPGRRPPGTRRCPGPRRRRRRGGVRRDGRRPPIGQHRPRRRPADDVRAGGPLGGGGPGGDPRLPHRGPGRRPRGVLRRGLPALGPAPRPDLPGPAGVAAPAPPHVAADRPIRFGSPSSSPSTWVTACRACRTIPGLVSQ